MNQDLHPFIQKYLQAKLGHALNHQADATMILTRHDGRQIIHIDLSMTVALPEPITFVRH
jgi:hypothetical protein